MRGKPHGRAISAPVLKALRVQGGSVRYIIRFILMIPLVSAAANRTLTCSYSAWSDENGLHDVSKEFKLVFVIDDDTEKSYMIGNNGSTDVLLVEKTDQVGFIEVTDTGNIVTTAIDKSLKSVHSRNSIILGELVPSQYYGSCKQQ